MRSRPVLLVLVLAVSAVMLGASLHDRSETPASPKALEAVERVSDGDTIVLDGGMKVRLVQIDTPEVYHRPECYGEEASAETEHLLPHGTLVSLVRERATSSVDEYGRLLRYVIRHDGLNVNLRLVRDGAAAPYFFHGARGEYASALLHDAEEARAAGRGLWGACRGTRLDPTAGVSTGDPPH